MGTSLLRQYRALPWLHDPLVHPLEEEPHHPLSGEHQPPGVGHLLPRSHHLQQQQSRGVQAQEADQGETVSVCGIVKYYYGIKKHGYYSVLPPPDSECISYREMSQFEKKMHDS